jgi:hypothetical protein
MFTGWSSEPEVGRILEGLSRLHDARFRVMERDPGDADAPAGSDPGRSGRVVVGDAHLGWVVLESGGGGTSGPDVLATAAAAVISSQVGTLSELESLSGEIADTYEELNLLYNLHESLGSLRDEQAICRAVLEQAQRVIGGERGCILLLNPRTGFLEIAAHNNMPEGADLKTPLQAGQGVSGWVLESGRGIIADDSGRLPEGVSRRADGRPADYLLVQPPLLSVPLLSRGQRLGVINLSLKAFGRPFTSQDLKLAQALAGEAALFVETTWFIVRLRDAERLQKEIEIARTIQQGLLPRRDPVIAGMDVAGACRPASHVGGDYYGFMEEAVPGMTGVAIMDVSGHNVGAAVCMASTRSILRCEAWSRRSTREVVERVNDIVCEDLLEGGMYATLFYSLYDHNTGDLRYTNAGHPAPLLLKADEQRCRRLSLGGMGIGICARQLYREETVRMTAGDVLLLYTDGLTETRGPDSAMFGETRLAQAVGRYRHATAWEIVSALLGEAEAFSGGAAQTDDIALVVMKATSTTVSGQGGPR